MNKLLLLPVLLVGLFVAAGCVKDLPPVCYQQIYRIDGHRTDADKLYDKGKELSVPEYRTELEKLFATYPGIKSSLPLENYRLGFYFRQGNQERYIGEGIADLCNHCAWFVLNSEVLQDGERKKYAKDIVTYLEKFDIDAALKLLALLREKAVPGAFVRENITHYDEECIDYKSTVERVIGRTGGKENPRWGLSRTYHLNGMLEREVFYKNDVPVEYEFSYSDDGRLLSVYYYRANGMRIKKYESVKSSETAK